MNDLLALYGRMFVIGVAVAAPVGPLGVLCIQRTLDRGWRTGLATGLGIATGDGTYAMLAAFGLVALSTALVAWQTPLRLVGGAVLVWLGMRSLIAPARGDCVAAAEPDRQPRHAATYLSAVGLTLTNPLTIMSFGAVFASAGLVAQPGVASAATVTLGIASGSLAWWLALITGVTLARHAASERFIAGISRVSGAVVAGFGVLAIASAFLR
jgi:putative LysE/RhtB family amino acid efflux pump